MGKTSSDVLECLDAICYVLAHPVSDVNLISQVLSANYGSVKFMCAPVDRTFLCMSCESSPPKSVVFFLGSTNDRIEASIVGDENELSSLCDLMRSDNPELEGVSMMGISQMVNPVFNLGSERLTCVTLLVAHLPAKGDRTIGIVFGFPFGIRLRLHVFDDHRLSICFNDVCDTIVSQA